jgi:hypothetical protein
MYMDEILGAGLPQLSFGHVGWNSKKHGTKE